MEVLLFKKANLTMKSETIENGNETDFSKSYN